MCDYLSVGRQDIVTSFLEHLKATWKTTDPLYLVPGEKFSFLGITLEFTSVGLLLHQRAYTEAFLEEYKTVTPQRTRATTGEPEHFENVASPPDMTNPEHVEWEKLRRSYVLFSGCQLEPNLTLFVQFVWLPNHCGTTWITSRSG